MSDVFSAMRQGDFENILFCHDKATGLQAIIAVHDTTLGPAFGGTRMRAYPDEQAAVADALALARGMTYKNAAAGLNIGGAKGVIIGNPATEKNEALLRAYGRFVQRLGGLFITASDYGTNPADITHMNAETPYAIAIPETGPRQGSISEATAIGLVAGMRAAAAHAFDTSDLSGMRVAIQGAGAVGGRTARLLVEAGAQVTAADVNPERLRALELLGVKTVGDPQRLYEADVEVFCPCAVGGVITIETAEKVGARMVVGAANNQLASPEAGEVLHERGVLYAPDFIVNAGGISYAADRGVDGRPHEEALARLDRIGDTTDAVFTTAAAEQITPLQAAERVAERRLTTVGGARRLAIPSLPAMPVPV
ncbi:Glu/Leu/Phe/Val family dehydrogenase [Streptomyces sp. NPDC002285]